VAFVALLTSLAAVGGAAFAWAVQLGIAGAFGVHAALGLG
jgi:hypothetical protein